MQLISPAEDLPQPRKKHGAGPSDLRREGWSPPVREVLSITERETHFWGTWDASSITQTYWLSPSQSGFFSLLSFTSVTEASGTIPLLPAGWLHPLATAFPWHPGDNSSCQQFWRLQHAVVRSALHYWPRLGREKQHFLAKKEKKGGKKCIPVGRRKRNHSGEGGEREQRLKVWWNQVRHAKAWNDGVLAWETSNLVQKYTRSWRMTNESALLGHLCARERGPGTYHSQWQKEAAVSVVKASAVSGRERKEWQGARCNRSCWWWISKQSQSGKGVRNACLGDLLLVKTTRPSGNASRVKMMNIWQFFQKIHGVQEKSQSSW